MNALTIFDLETLIEARDFAALRKETRNWPAGDLADLMESLVTENRQSYSVCCHANKPRRSSPIFP